ncbi:hypothetical protein PXC01_18315 [Maribacter sp. M208]|uniref:hypothetical protein n=1 Tax=Maribacter huludaoensis TaxID=3030010 RepID=UPI0023EABFB3|nr:hypothetical protein [Maribacter huludaoensis]MDF4223557.1 hypothetical protein [Maribacter huludaoensis]
MRQIIVFFLVVFSLSVSAQEEEIKYLDIIGCWTKSLIPNENKDLNIYSRCDTGNGSIIMDFRESGVYRVYSRNLNTPSRCGNYITKRIDHWGKYEYDSEKQTIDVYSYGGEFEYTWELLEVENGKIGLIKS